MTAQVDAIAKIKGPITRSQASGEKEGHKYTGLSMVVIIVVVVIVISTVVVIMLEFCGGVGVAPVVSELILAAGIRDHRIPCYSSSSELTIVGPTAIAYRQNLVLLLGLGWYNM